MEAECVNTAEQPLYVEQPGVGALVGLQAGSYESDIGTELPQVLVAIRPAIVRQAQPLADLCKKYPIRHPIMASRGNGPGSGQQHHVLVDFLRELGRHTRSAATL